MFPWSNVAGFGQDASNYSNWHSVPCDQDQPCEGFQWTTSADPVLPTTVQPEERKLSTSSSEFYSPTNVWYVQRGYTPIVQHSPSTPEYAALPSAETLLPQADSSMALQRFASCTNVQTPQPMVDPHKLDRSFSEGADHFGTRLQKSEDVAKKGPGARRYRCRLCPEDFPCRQDLQTHTIRHDTSTIKKDFKCAECSKAFSTSTYLVQHTRTHSQERPFGPCEHCGKKFLQLTHLQQHVRTHTGERPYSCEVPGCNRSFAQLSNLRNHSRNHAEAKPHKCKSCYKSFETDILLYEHIQVHKRSKHHRVHVCPYCGKSYAMATYLSKHLARHHPLKDFMLPCTASQERKDATSSATSSVLSGPSEWSYGETVKRESMTREGCWTENQHCGSSEMHENMAVSGTSSTSQNVHQMFASQQWQHSTQALMTHPWHIDPRSTEAQPSQLVKNESF